MNLGRTGIVESPCIQLWEIVPLLVISIQAIRKFLIQVDIGLIQLNQFIQGMIFYRQWNQFVRLVGRGFAKGGTSFSHSGNAKEALHRRCVFRIAQPFDDNDEVVPEQLCLGNLKLLFDWYIEFGTRT